MKKLLSVAMACLMLLALAAGTAAADEIDAAALISASTPGQIVEAWGTYAQTTVYSETGSELLDGLVLTQIFGMNGGSCEVFQSMLYSDGVEEQVFFTSDPEDGLCYVTGTDGAFVTSQEPAEALEYFAYCNLVYYESLEITDIREENGCTIVTVVTDACETDEITLDAQGRILSIDSVYDDTAQGMYMHTVTTFTYDDVEMDYSPREANAENAENARAGALVLGSSISIATEDIHGEPVTDDLIRDARFVMVNLWEPWCGPCVGEMPDLQKLYENYKDQGLIILGVYSTFEMDDQALALIEEDGITYPILRCSDGLAVLNQDYVPATFFLTGSGELLTPEPYAGARSYEEWEQIVLQFLG